MGGVNTWDPTDGMYTVQDKYGRRSKITASEYDKRQATREKNQRSCLMTIIKKDSAGRQYVYETDQYGREIPANQRRYLGPSNEEIARIDKAWSERQEKGEQLIRKNAKAWSEYQKLDPEEKMSAVNRAIFEAERKNFDVDETLFRSNLKRALLEYKGRKGFFSSSESTYAASFLKARLDESSPVDQIMPQLFYFVGENKEKPLSLGVAKPLGIDSLLRKLLFIAYAKSITSPQRDEWPAWLQSFERMPFSET